MLKKYTCNKNLKNKPPWQRTTPLYSSLTLAVSSTASLAQAGLALLLKRLLRLSGRLSHTARDYLGGVMVRLSCSYTCSPVHTPAILSCPYSCPPVHTPAILSCSYTYSPVHTPALVFILLLPQVFPCLLALLALPAPALALASFLASLLPAALLGTSLGQQAAPLLQVMLLLLLLLYFLLQALLQLYIEKRNFVNNFGLNTFLEAEWGRLRVPAVLRTFWLSRAALLLLLQVQSIVLVPSDLSSLGAWQLAGPLPVQHGEGGAGQGLGDRGQCAGHDQHRLHALALVWCRLPGERPSCPLVLLSSSDDPSDRGRRGEVRGLGLRRPLLCAGPADRAHRHGE